MDSKTPLESKILEIEGKIKTAQLPADFTEKLNEELSVLRLSLKGENSFMNFENFSNYVHCILSLPFNKETKDTLDIASAKEILDKNHYGLPSVKNVILEYLSSLILNINNQDNIARSPIICLVGLVGTGKTTLAYSIAESLGRKFERIPLGGMGDASDLRGKSRSGLDAEPGLVIKSLIHAQSKNCVILLDELDRITEAGRKDIMGVLVELLDPEQNKAFQDHYVDFPFDLSRVLFIATANNTTNIATAVLDRLQIIQMPSYTDEEKTVIAQEYLFPEILKQTGLIEAQLIIDEAVWPTIIRPLGFDSGIRSLSRAIETVCRKAARMIVEGKLQLVKVTSENVKEFLAE
ncbi:MAG: ATP-dependent protease La, ATP-dependent Lon protease [Candidatus Levybacteria bacterium]|nr:ATP-dependent protease La, ATP-dependent Lon protease [Candidatus Levybacteria bacterium]